MGLERVRAIVVLSGKKFVVVLRVFAGILGSEMGFDLFLRGCGGECPGWGAQRYSGRVWSLYLKGSCAYPTNFMVAGV
jgi:hypothetical protein